MVHDKMLALVLKQLRKPYVWGAKGPEAFDCSGLHEWASSELYGPGRFPGRQTAACFWNLLGKVSVPFRGCAAFWRNSAGKIYHMGTVSDVVGPAVYVVGAHGGGSRTTTIQIALEQGARVRQKCFRMSGIAGFRAWPDEAVPLEPKTTEDVEQDEGRHDGAPPEEWV